MIHHHACSAILLCYRFKMQLTNFNSSIYPWYQVTGTQFTVEDAILDLVAVDTN